MDSKGSVTLWIPALKSGDAGAAQQVWQRYYNRLIGLARKKLNSARKGEADEEDVVQNAFNSFFQGIRQSRFPRIDDRDSLWRLLVVITARKALDQVAHQRTKRQGGGMVRTESGIYPIEPELDEPAIQQVVGPEPTPEFAAQVAEQYEHLLERLGDETLRTVAVWKMEGFTNEEIAAKMKSSLRSVARKLETIRLIWREEALP